MDKPVKDWGKGIPEYTDADLLRGKDLQEFCTQIVARGMQEDGFTIDGIIVNNTPAQVIAKKNGRQYAVMVAGDIYPQTGSISYRMKQDFADFYQQHGYVPQFAPVSLMPMDPERALAGLALKFDGYNIKYTGNEDLSQLKLPEPGEDGFRAYLAEQIIRAYTTGIFEPLFPYMAEDIEQHSFWVKEPRVGKKAVMKYYTGKGEALRNSKADIAGYSVIITKSLGGNSNVKIYTEKGKICALLRQNINGRTNWIIVLPDYDKNDMLIRISIHEPSFFSFRALNAYE